MGCISESITCWSRNTPKWHPAPAAFLTHTPASATDTGTVCWSVFAAVWEMYTGEDAFEGLQHPGQFFETVVLHNLRPVIPQGMLGHLV